MAYALGANMFTPWDIYLPTPHADRYYGTPAEYGDISRRRGCHVTGIPSPSILKRLLKGEGGAAE